MKLLNIGIDVDDTITDTFEFVQPFVAEFYNLDINYVKDNEISYNTLTDEMKKTELEFAKKYFEKNISNVKIKDDARKYITKLKELGHKIIIITARDEMVYNDAYKITSDYLIKHNIPFDKIICNGDKATECLNNKIDILIDDSKTNCENVKNVGVDVLMFACKSNVNIYKFDKVNNWKETYEYITNYANK